MTVRDWLHDRPAHPPARLADRIDQVLGVRGDAPTDRASDACVDAAARLLAELLTHPAAGRESALDLLTVDALVTYAFEAASDDPSTLPERAHDAMRRLAAAARE